MQLMTESWTDGRLDDLCKRVDDGFRQVDEHFRHVDERFKHVDERFRHVDERFKQVDERFRQVDDRFDRLEDRMEKGFATLRKEANENRDFFIHELNARFDSLHSSIVYSLIGLTGTFVAAMLALIAIHP
jgi:predicted nuclease with TOPRIM domain